MIGQEDVKDQAGKVSGSVAEFERAQRALSRQEKKKEQSKPKTSTPTPKGPRETRTETTPSPISERPNETPPSPNPTVQGCPGQDLGCLSESPITSKKKKMPKKKAQDSTLPSSSSSSSGSDSDSSSDESSYGRGQEGGIDARRLRSFSAGYRTSIREAVNLLLEIQSLPGKVDQSGGTELSKMIGRLSDSKQDIRDALKEQSKDREHYEKEREKVKDVKSMLSTYVEQLRDNRVGSFGATLLSLGQDELLVKIAGSRRSKRMLTKLKDEIKSYKTLAGKTLEQAQAWQPRRDGAKRGPRQHYSKSYGKFHGNGGGYYGQGGSGFGSGYGYYGTGYGKGSK